MFKINVDEAFAVPFRKNLDVEWESSRIIGIEMTDPDSEYCIPFKSLFENSLYDCWGLADVERLVEVYSWFSDCISFSDLI